MIKRFLLSHSWLHCTSNTTLHTLHSTQYTVHTTHHTHYTHYTPHTTHYTLHPTHYTLHTLHTTHYTLHTTHYTLHTTHYTLHPTHYTHYTRIPGNPAGVTLKFSETRVLFQIPHQQLLVPPPVSKCRFVTGSIYVWIYVGVQMYIYVCTYNPTYTHYTTPYTLHTTHYTLHTTHYTLHPTHYTLHTTHYTLHLVYLLSATLPRPYVVHHSPDTIHSNRVS